MTGMVATVAGSRLLVAIAAAVVGRRLVVAGCRLRVAITTAVGNSRLLIAAAAVISSGWLMRATMATSAVGRVADR